MALDTIRLKDPTRFEDPFKLHYNKYIKTQYERVRLHETVTGPHRDPRSDRDLDALMTPIEGCEPTWWEDGTPGAGALDQPSHKGRMTEQDALEGVDH